MGRPSRVLVTGGAGYIGSHTVIHLIRAGYQVVVVDDFRNAKATVVPRLEELTGTHLRVHAIDIRETDKLAELIAGEQIEAVVHFAGSKAVGESVTEPLEYYRNNVEGTMSLLEAMRRNQVSTIVFSSSATVYGPNAPVPMTEDLPTSATNPYGWSKVMIEQILRDLAAPGARDAADWRIALLRYFNPVGAHESGRIGEDPNGIPNNLMPFIAQVAIGRREELAVFGDDYDTPDGTGVRDYIHVEDLAAGHVAALRWVAANDRPVSTWNLGTGRGTSVLQLRAAFEEASGVPIPYRVVDRRPGDIDASFASATLAETELGWRATRDVAQMCADTWRWQQANPAGFPD